MLDVHAPEHRIGTVSDFLMHLLTITVGLLIALALENAAEALHHRSLRKEAEANIRQELRQNRDTLLAASKGVMQERDNLLSLMVKLETRSGGAPLPKGDIDASFSESPIPDSAWRTASASGVLAYMNYDETERFADAYKQQDMLQTAEEQALDDYLQFAPSIQLHHADLSPEQAKEVLPLVRRALAHVNGMLAIGQGTLEAYKDALK